MLWSVDKHSFYATTRELKESTVEAVDSDANPYHLFNFNGIITSVYNKSAVDFVYNLFVSELKNHRVNFELNVREILVG